MTKQCCFAVQTAPQPHDPRVSTPSPQLHTSCSTPPAQPCQLSAREAVAGGCQARQVHVSSQRHGTAGHETHHQFTRRICAHCAIQQGMQRPLPSSIHVRGIGGYATAAGVLYALKAQAAWSAHPVCSLSMASLPAASGGGTYSSTSSRPGRSSAGSSPAGRLVAASSSTPASTALGANRTTAQGSRMGRNDLRAAGCWRVQSQNTCTNDGSTALSAATPAAALTLRVLQAVHLREQR